jgi:hypothetical protein
MSPWGKIDSVTKYAPGFSFVSTPGHGGFRVSKGQLNKLAINPEFITRIGGIVQGSYVFFEEDCAYNLFLLDAPQALQIFAKSRDKDSNTLFNDCLLAVKRWYPHYFNDEVTK